MNLKKNCSLRWVLAFVAAFGKRQPEPLMSKNTKADDMFCCQIDNVRLERKMKRELKLMLRRVSRHNANTFVTCLFFFVAMKLFVLYKTNCPSKAD